MGKVTVGVVASLLAVMLAVAADATPSHSSTRSCSVVYDTPDAVFVAVRPDGTHRRALPWPMWSEWPDVSHDGTRVALVVDPLDDSRPVAIDILGIDGRLLLSIPTSAPDGLVGPVRWSPDDRYLAYVDDNDIYVTAVTGGAQVDLTRYAHYDRREGAIGSLSWAPGGRRVVFSIFAAWGSRIRPGIYTVKTDGSAMVPLRLPRSAGGADWSLHGSGITFDGGDDARGIYVAHPDGTHLRRLTRESDAAPYWSPDGKLIAFTGSLGGDPPVDVYVMRADGSKLRRLTRTPDTPHAIGSAAQTWLCAPS